MRMTYSPQESRFRSGTDIRERHVLNRKRASDRENIQTRAGRFPHSDAGRSSTDATYQGKPRSTPLAGPSPVAGQIVDLNDQIPFNPTQGVGRGVPTQGAGNEFQRHC